MSDTFTKLASNIITSSIWSEDDKTRIVWITLLALCDQDGFAETSIPGLSAVARVPLADTVKAVEKLSSPDAFSRTTEHEGRRITAVEGGFVILNHAKYRDKARGENRKEYIRGYMRDYMRNVRQVKSNNCLTDVKPSVSVSVSDSVSVSKRDVKEGERVEKETKPKIEPLTGENFSDRSKQANNGRLSSNEIERFVGYWTETNAKGRCRFQAEKFFDIGRRISTWASRLNVDKSVKIQANPANKPLDW